MLNDLPAQATKRVLCAGSPACPDAGLWHPVLCLRPKKIIGVPEQPEVRAVLIVAICAMHRAGAEAKDFITEDLWKLWVRQFEANGLRRPKRSETRLEWCEVGSSEALAFHGRRA